MLNQQRAIEVRHLHSVRALQKPLIVRRFFMPAEREVGPDECVLLTAVPLDHPTFVSQSHRDAHAYVPRIMAAHGGDADVAWHAYKPIADLILHATEQLVKQRGAAATIASACNTYQVVTIIAHGADTDHGAVIEMSDGFITASALANCIPRDFTRVLHLISCESTRRLLAPVKAQAPGCTVLTRVHFTNAVVQGRVS